MLTQAILQSSTPTVLNIEDADPEEILILTGISDLSKAGADLYLGEFARDGGYYQGRRAKKRNPVFTFKLNPDYPNDVEVSDIRELLYRMFMEPQADSDGLQVTLVDDRKPDRYFICYAEDVDAPMWEKEQIATVSTLCTDAYLRSAAVTSGANAQGWLSVPITYDGSADTGFELTIKVAVANSTVVIKNNNQTMILDGPWAVNDIITVNTSEGDRFIRKNGVDAMASLRSGSGWLTLKQAQNTLVVYGTDVGDGKALVTSYSYRSAWWGI